ncbi:MAG: ECF-type sigma factor [Phycisphaerae bacterium]
MSSRSPQDVTQLLTAAGCGDPSAADALLPLVYDELRKLARARMAHEPAGQTLQPTALVHEAYLRLLGDGGEDIHWENRGHFFGAAALAMRRILVERARRVGRVKHGGDRRRFSLDDVNISADEQSQNLLALDEVLEKLESIDPRKNKIVMLRYFAGLTIEETSQAIGLSKTTVKDEWQFTKAWLYGELTRG